jgi:uncharacterized protein (TIGR04540 family)
LDILKNPTTVKLLATQIIKACDDYIALKITEKHLKELIFHYAAYHGNKLFAAKGINPIFCYIYMLSRSIQSIGKCYR